MLLCCGSKVVDIQLTIENRVRKNAHTISCKALIVSYVSATPGRGDSLSEVLIEQGDGFHALEELVEEVAFVGGVDRVALETEAH